MTAMRLKRYPSASGGFALGKIGVGATMLKQGKTARDYVQNGLVAMWDGIENVGWGVHDANATTWKDLVGGYDFDVSLTNAEWGANKFIPFNNQAATRAFLPWNENYTLEFVTNIISPATRNSAFIILGTYNNAYYFGLLYRNSNESIMAFRGFYSSGALAGLRGYSFGSITNFTAPAYINGVATNPTGYNTLDVTTARGSLARIGGTGDLTSLAEIYSMRVYSRVLSADEISAHYAIDKERFNLP